MGKYQYITSGGNTATVEAADPNSALRNAVDIARNSGVMALNTPTAPVEQTIGEVYKPFKAPSVDTEYDSALKGAIDSSGKAANSAVDEDSIRRRTLEMFQAEIDATNQIYGEKLREVKSQGLGRLGSNTAINARSGTLGSPSGEATFKNVEDQNASIENLVNQERLSKISSIMGFARSEAAGEIAAKRKAQEEGLQSYLKFLGSRTERKQTSLKSAAAAMLNQKVSPKDLDPKQLEDLATTYGVSVNDLINAYDTEVKAVEETDRKAKLEALKSQPEIVKEFEYAKTNGFKGTFTQYQNEDANRKRSIAGDGTKPKTSGTLMYTEADIADGQRKMRQYIGTDGYIDPFKYKDFANLWVQNGGIIDDFIANYPPKNYVNPEGNQYLPTYLRTPVSDTGRSF